MSSKTSTSNSSHLNGFFGNGGSGGGGVWTGETLSSLSGKSSVESRDKLYRGLGKTRECSLDLLLLCRVFVNALATFK